MAPASTPPDQTRSNAKRRYDHLMATLTTLVATLNDALGYETGPGTLDSPKITVGYLGNCSMTPGGYDDRQWHVFLPHPGRVGTYDDQVGSWATDDVEGIAIAVTQVSAMVKMARHLTEQRLLAGWSTR